MDETRERKVLFVTDRWDWGGVPTVIRMLSKGLIESGYNVHLITWYGINSAIPLPDGVKTRAFEAKSRLDVRVGWKFRAYLEEVQPDIIHDHFGGLWSGYWLWSPKWAMKSIFHLHNEWNTVAESPDSKRTIRDILFRTMLLPQYAKVLCVSQHIMHGLLDYSPISPEKVSVLYNAVSEVEVSHHVPQKRDESQRLTIGLHGRVVFEKGQDRLIRLASRLRNEFGIECNVLIIGRSDPNYARHLQQLSEELGIREQVSFMEQVSDIPAHLARMDVFVFCSRQEPFGLALLEAMQQGIACMGYRQEKGGGPDEIMQDFPEQALFHEHEETALVRQMAMLLNDEQKRADWGVACKQQAERFSEKPILSRLLSEYRKLLL